MTSKEKSDDSPKYITSSSQPMIFISHDSQDFELAEAFSDLLKAVSSGMLKTFRSSDKKGIEGIEYGDEWYKRLISKIEDASDVVCLFTERSLERPWILYEAGVAKGKLNTPVLGIALGIPLSRVSVGPFYQFQNCDDSEERLKSLVMQLAKRVPEMSPVPKVVESLVKEFKSQEDKILKKISSKSKNEDRQIDDNVSVAKLFEEVKIMYRDLPARIEDMLSGDMVYKTRYRRFHPMMFEEILHKFGKKGDPIGILMMASLFRHDFPWLYEIAVDAYRAVKSGNLSDVEQAMMSVRQMFEISESRFFMEAFGMRSKELHMMVMDMPRFLDEMIRRCIKEKKPVKRTKKESSTK